MKTTVASDLQLRPASPDDAPFAADVLTAVRPSQPTDPEILRYWWSQPDENLEFRRWLIVRGDGPIGYGVLEHPRWEVQPERYGTIFFEIVPAARDAATLQAALARFEQAAREDGARTARAFSYDDDQLRIDAILARGFKEDRRSKRWELDLVANRERLLAMTEESRARMRKEGVRILTLAEDDDPEVVEKLWRMSEEAGDDVPTTVPRVREELGSYMRWIAAPEVHRDRFWIARIGDDVVGVSVLAYPPVRGIVGTNWTATARSVRGRGVARALKCETVAQAIALGVDRVRTGNDAANAPILHINETMGYRPIAGGIGFLKAL